MGWENPLLIPTAKQAHPQVFAISNNLLYVLQELVAVVRSMLLCRDAAGALMCCHWLPLVRGFSFLFFPLAIAGRVLAFCRLSFAFWSFSSSLLSCSTNPFVPSAAVQCFTGFFPPPRMPVLSRLPPARAPFSFLSLPSLRQQHQQAMQVQPPAMKLNEPIKKASKKELLINDVIAPCQQSEANLSEEEK